MRYRSPDEDSARWDGFPFRQGDIVISTRSKSGTTWVQMICALLIFQTADLPAPLSTLSPWLDWLIMPREDVFARLDAQRHRRFVKTHTPLDGIPIDPRATYIVVARHPLDMAVSLFHQGANLNRARIAELTRTATPDTTPTPAADATPASQSPPTTPSAAPAGHRPTESPGTTPTSHHPPPRITPTGDNQPATSGVGLADRDRPASPPMHDSLTAWIDRDVTPADELDSLPGVMWHLADAWRRRDDDNVLLVHYADLSTDLSGEMRRIADRLGIDVPANRWDGLVAAAGFAQMRARASQLAPDPAGIMTNRDAFFRRGNSGAGRELLTDAEFAHYLGRAAMMAPLDLLAWLHR
jgi:aryl sulfotransferase